MTIQEKCFRYIGPRASSLISSDECADFGPGLLEELIARDDLCAPEMAIFDLVRRWSAKVQHGSLLLSVLMAQFNNLMFRATASQVPEERNPAAKQICGQYLRLSLLSLRDLMRGVRPSGLVDDAAVRAVFFSLNCSGVTPHPRSCQQKFKSSLFYFVSFSLQQ